MSQGRPMRRSGPAQSVPRGGVCDRRVRGASGRRYFPGPQATSKRWRRLTSLLTAISPQSCRLLGTLQGALGIRLPSNSCIGESKLKVSNAKQLGHHRRIAPSSGSSGLAFLRLLIL